MWGFSLIDLVCPQLMTSLSALSVGVVQKGGGAPKPRRGNQQPQSMVTSGAEQLIPITVGTPSGAFVGGTLRLIPTFAPRSRLSQLALQYSQYTVEYSRVAYVAETSTTTSGRLGLAWTFDVPDQDPTEVEQILQISRARSTVLWKNISTTMPSRAPEKRRYAVISSGDYSALSPADQQQYTPASCIFGSESSAQSGLTTGHLVWHYRIRFYNPNATINFSKEPNLFEILSSLPAADDDEEPSEPPATT